MFAFCDGSVRLFRTGGDVNNLRWLSGRSDGVVVKNDDSVLSATRNSGTT
jgi:hypothetical protein